MLSKVRKILLICLVVVLCLPLLVSCSKSKVDSRTKSEIEKIRNARVGDYIFFGSYEQDNVTSNGKEAIEWLVLAKENDKALVISRYALDYQPYNYVSSNVTWETCSLRKWLNGDFLADAFTEGEQEKIDSSTVTADKNPFFNTPPGNETTDKVFLLSVIEADTNFNSGSVPVGSTQCAPTDYAIAQGVFVFTFEGRSSCSWWLRTPGDSSEMATYVDDYEGDIYQEVSYDGKVLLAPFSSICSSPLGIRPAMWIDCN